MTAGAVGTELSIMNVIRLVAVGAVAAQAHLCCQRLPVARFAVDPHVRAFEFKCGLHVVIKYPLPPFDRVVTEGAAFAEASVMGVVLAMAIDALLRCITEHVRIMAILAFTFRVLAQQRETGQAVIEENVVLPGQLIVAVRAGGAERAVVGIVVFMAGQAIRGECDFENGLDVAGRALDFRVSAKQSVPGVDVMVEMDLRPTGTRVAGLARFAEVTLVVVVFTVTADAFHRELVRERVLAMAGVALLLGMLAIEQEAGIAIVVEARVIPAHGAVAIAAVVATATVVGVVLGVAAKARRRGIGERVVRMAVEAGRFLVFADQRIAGGVVVESHLLPVVGSVTITALRTECPGVRVVVLVAGKAVARRFPAPLVGLVTVVAIVVGVFAEQREVGEFVIEGLRIEADDIRVATLMVGVTGGARSLAGPTILAVEAKLPIDVVRDLFVTVEAQCTLLAAFKPQVAVGAFLFVLGVRFDDLARHDQGFDLGARGAGKCKRQSHQESEEVSSMLHASRPALVHVHRENVNEGRQHHQDEDWQVQNVPERKQSLVQ